MKLLNALERTALGAVLLLAAACSGSDDFEPAPGASIEVADFEGVISTAMAEMDLQELNSIPLEGEEFEEPRPSCFEVEVGPCSVGDPEPNPPGHAIRYHDSEDREITVTLQLATDALHAGDLVEGQTGSLLSIETQAWRLMAAPPPHGQVASGPCDTEVDPDEEQGCAWQDRGAPGVGDSAGALQNNVVTDSGYAAVAFARHYVFAVVMVRQYESGTPGGIADDVAEAVDEQIKAALSR